jgi:diamine N-acetyltransferase
MHVTLPGQVLLRFLRHDDAVPLGAYFDALSAETNRRFQPHPLTRSHAAVLCAAPDSGTERMVLEHPSGIIGYFILDLALQSHDASRYARIGITLEPGRDLLFAPCIADAWQSRGLASLAMPHLIALARARGARSLVLMGGTQSTNARAIRFYEKFGFQTHGGYQTDQWNHDMRLVLG